MNIKGSFHPGIAVYFSFEQFPRISEWASTKLEHRRSKNTELADGDV